MKPPIKNRTPPTRKREAPKKTPAPAPMPGTMHTASSAEEMRYKAESALDTLKRAEEIKKDPHLMGHVKAHAKEQRDHLTRVIRRKT
jgi:hypothetical protein